MARRFRVIQYDGPDDWIIGVFDRSLKRLDLPSGTIKTWEVSEGGIVTARYPKDIEYCQDDRFSDLDDPDHSRKLEICEYEKPGGVNSGACEGCGGRWSHHTGRPDPCLRRSIAKAPLGGGIPG